MNISNINQYLNRIWSSRYFWTHLALSDLRTKFRRSKLGIVWALLIPLFLTLLLSFVMGGIFRHPIGTYAPYVFSGIIMWNFIVDSSVGGCTALINAEGYMKQFNHPTAIYSLRNVLFNFILFCLGLIGLILWIAIWKISNLNLSLFSFLITFPIYFMLAWSISICTAFLNVKFRDFSQMIILIFQALWYGSPVFISQDIFIKAHLEYLVYYNPIAHLLNLLRQPMLYGQFPHLVDYYYSIGVTLVFMVLAFIYITRNEKQIIFAL